eukprot:TRINITY_DN14597_c0_g2_i1.p1 TRINITY_DN14597_c0_g2~~TRINITY_DN14597_c0_g2_i1.p1  ORF type:complete len:666 (+),score=77.17 TRINITY_DN14597_c0_g2_i1:51-2000(+)
MVPWEEFSAEAYGIFVVLGINAICLILYCVLLGWTAATSVSWQDLRASAASWSQQLRYLLCLPCCNSASTKVDAFEARVRHLAEVRRTERGRKSIAVAVHMFAAFAVLNPVALGYYDVEKFADAAFSRNALHQSSVVTGTLCLVLGLGVYAFDHHVTPTTLDVCHCLMLARMVWQASAAIDVYELLGVQTANTVGRLVLAMIIGTPTLTCGLNVFCTFVKSWQYVVLLASMSSEEQAVAKTIYGSAFSLILAEVFVWMNTWLVSSSVQTWSRGMERSRLEAKKASASEVTIKSLLAVLCDAAIVVCENVTLTAPSMHFAHFLQRQPPPDGYLGASLLDFVVQQDRERLHQAIVSSANGGGSPLSVATALSRGSGARLPVRMYCVSFLDHDDRRGYYIGILEVKEAETSILGNLQAWHLAEAAPALELETVRGHSKMRSVSETCSSISAESTGAETALVPLLADGSEVEVWVDLGQSTLPILHASPSVTQIVGPLVYGRSSLCDWVDEDASLVLVQDMFDAFDAYTDSKDESMITANLGRRYLRPMHALRAGIQYATEVTLDFSPSMDAAVDTSNQIPVILRFEKIGVKKASRGNSRSSRSRKSRRLLSSRGAVQEKNSSADVPVGDEEVAFFEAGKERKTAERPESIRL